MKIRPKLTLKQRILDSLCILMCVGTVIYTAIMYPKLPEMIPASFRLSGEISNYSSKSTLLFLLAIDCLMTASLCVLIRVPGLYKTINTPWPIPWGRKELVVRVTKDFICWCNLCMTATFAYITWCCVNAQSPA